MLEMDAFFQNEDRHTNNIALLYYPQRDAFDYCPYFDFGAGLYSDITNDYPLNKNIEECAKKICAKPFSKDFDEQTDEACSLYQGGFRFNAGKQELMKRWRQIRKEYEKESIRPVAKEITARTEEFLYSQIRKYQYLFLK